MSGLPSEAVFQIAGMPFSLAMLSSDMARTIEETPMMVRTKKETQATMRAIAQM